MSTAANFSNSLWESLPIDWKHFAAMGMGGVLSNSGRLPGTHHTPALVDCRVFWLVPNSQRHIVMLAGLHVSWHAKGQAHPTLNLPNGPSWGYSGHIPRKSWFTKMRTRQVTIERCSGGKGFCDRKHAVWGLRRSLPFYAWFIKNFSHCSVCAEATVTFLLGHSAQSLLVDRFAAVFNWDVLLFLVHALLMFEPSLRNHPSNRGPLYSICAMFCKNLSFWQYCSTACWLAQANFESKLPRRSKFQAPGEVAKRRVFVTLGLLRR